MLTGTNVTVLMYRCNAIQSGTMANAQLGKGANISTSYTITFSHMIILDALCYKSKKSFYIVYNISARTIP